MGDSDMHVCACRRAAVGEVCAALERSVEIADRRYQEDSGVMWGRKF